MSFPIETEALVVDSVGSGFTRRPVTLKDMRPDEILVEMKYTGVCHTDVVGERGQFPQVEFPIIFGHEGAGIVRAIGSDIDDDELKVGDAVICCYNYCGNCKPCKGGRLAACARHADANLRGLRQSDKTTPVELDDGSPVRFQFYGQSSFCKMSVVSGKSYVRCPYPESIHHYCALGCGFQTGAGTILNALRPDPAKSVAVFGTGGVGMTAIMAAKILQVETIIAVDRVVEKLELAKEFGATHTINTAQRPDIPRAMLEITGTGADYVVECTGIPQLMDALLDSVAAEGVCAVLGVPPIGYTMPVKPLDMVLDNKTVRGIVQGESISRKFLPEMMELHRSGQFPIDKLCKIYPISEMERALEDVSTGKVIKPILKWD